MQQRTWFRALQRWRFPLSAILDALLRYGAFFAALLARLDFDFDFAQVNVATLLQIATVAVAVQLVTGLATGLYQGRRTLASFREVRLVVFSTLLATLTSFAVVLLVGSPRPVPLSTVFAAGAHQLLGALGMRYFARLVVEITRRSTHPRGHRTSIFEAGDAREQISNALLRDPNTDLDPVAFLDDDQTKRRLNVNGVRVVGTRSGIADAAKRFEADTLLLALDPKRHTAGAGFQAAAP